jgi:hypothetical protein
MSRVCSVQLCGTQAANCGPQSDQESLVTAPTN